MKDDSVQHIGLISGDKNMIFFILGDSKPIKSLIVNVVLHFLVILLI